MVRIKLDDLFPDTYTMTAQFENASSRCTVGDMNYAPHRVVLYCLMQWTGGGGHELYPPQSGPVLFDVVDGGRGTLSGGHELVVLYCLM